MPKQGHLFHHDVPEQIVAAVDQVVGPSRLARSSPSAIMTNGSAAVEAGGPRQRELESGAIAA